MRLYHISRPEAEAVGGSVHEKPPNKTVDSAQTAQDTAERRTRSVNLLFCLVQTDFLAPFFALFLVHYTF